MVDAGLAAVFLLVLGGTAAALAVSWGGASWVVDLAVGAAAAVLALARRRRLLPAAVATEALAVAAIGVAWAADLPAEPGPALMLALAVLTGAAIRRLPARAAGAVAAGGLAVVAVSPLAAHSTSSIGLPPATLFAAAGWLVAVAGGLALRLRDQGRQTMIDRVRQEERLALARELHDVVAHHITGIVVQAQAARLTAPATVAAPLAGIESAGTEALTAVRRVVGLLRDPSDATPATPGPESLASLVRRFDDRGGPAVRSRLPAGDPGWPPEVTTTVYRIVQESLTNVSRHAPGAASVTVCVDADPAAVTVEVADDGPAPVARPAGGYGLVGGHGWVGGHGLVGGHGWVGGYGLVGMRERVESLGGVLSAGPRPGAGWSVRATLPVVRR